jgi:2'-5' RNA ligase
MRAFIAIELPLDIKNKLTKIQDTLKTNLPKISWVKPANLHLSLKFIGEISAQQHASAQQIIARIVKTVTPFEIKLETLDVFPNLSQARIIWIGTRHPAEQLKQLAAQLEEIFFQSGIPREQHAFQAHITLARIKHPIIAAILARELDRLKNGINGMDLKFNAAGITLFKSILGKGGPTYRILKKEDFLNLDF